MGVDIDIGVLPKDPLASPLGYFPCIRYVTEGARLRLRLKEVNSLVRPKGKKAICSRLFIRLTSNSVPLIPRRQTIFQYRSGPIDQRMPHRNFVAYISAK